MPNKVFALAATALVAYAMGWQAGRSTYKGREDLRHQAERLVTQAATAGRRTPRNKRLARKHR